VDLEQDPPPDLMVEVDITHTGIDKLRLYGAMGVPEFWRYNGESWRIYRLQNGEEYQEAEVSSTFFQTRRSRRGNGAAAAGKIHCLN